MQEWNDDRVPARVIANDDELGIIYGERASNAQRDRVASHLSWCYAQGYIDAAVHEARLSAVMKARDNAVLMTLMRDLPPLAEQAVPKREKLLARVTRWVRSDPLHRLVTVVAGTASVTSSAGAVIAGGIATGGDAGAVIEVMAGVTGVISVVALLIFTVADTL